MSRASLAVRAQRALAPAKVNLGLSVGPTRASDGRHELVTVMQSISLADVVTLEPAAPGAEADELVCAGVGGAPAENLAARALAEFRHATGWRAPPLRVSIDKRIPVAAGLAGGSADAAATLRLAGSASGLAGPELLREIGGRLGADVPAQLAPGRWLATGAGERLRALPAPASALGLLLLPAHVELSTAAVYAEADRLGLPRSREELERRGMQLGAALAHGAALPAVRELLCNDLQPAALSLCAQIELALAQALDCGAEVALVCGSGPTVAGLFAGERAQERLARAAVQLAARAAGAIAARPVGADFARPVALGAPPLA